jgi:glycosyltransferase involved in cell wall biosynthesis
MHDIPASDQLAEAPGQAELTVSVVIPAFNYARFLPEALDSIVRQKGARIEVIVVDDGSTDDPASVVQRYPGVKLIRQENRGLAAARNVGLRAATGDYIAFVDADDRLVEGAVETWLAEFRRKPDCGLVHGSYRSVDANWRPIWQPEPVSLGEDGFATLLERGNLIGVPAAVMYRTERLRAVGGFDEKGPG